MILGSKNYLYRTENLENGKFYIGITINPVDSGYLGSGKLLKRAVKKYGREKFKRIDLKEFDNRKKARKAEIEIVTQELVDNHNCYNVALGGRAGSPGNSRSEEVRRKISESLKGENNPSYGRSVSNETKMKISNAKKGKSHSEETCRKISDKLKGKIVSKEWCRKISESGKGNKNHMFGKKHSEKTKMKMSEAKKGNKSAHFKYAYCTLDECNKPHVAKGMCSSHYSRYWRENIK